MRFIYTTVRTVRIKPPRLACCIISLSPQLSDRSQLCDQPQPSDRPQLYDWTLCRPRVYVTLNPPKAQIKAVRLNWSECTRIGE